MADADSGAGGGFDDSDVGDVSEGAEGVESEENTESELYDDPTSYELYDPGYDHSEYETELMDFSYEKTNDTKNPPETEKSDVEQFNLSGEKVEGPPRVETTEFLKKTDDYDQTGLRENDIDWNTYAKDAIQDGFDKNEKPSTVTMQPGTIIARYGSEMGRFATDPGTDYEKLSLPYDEKTVAYTEYRVVEPIECLKGTVAVNFGREGKGTQYMFNDSIAQMIKDGRIERIEHGK